MSKTTPQSPFALPAHPSPVEVTRALFEESQRATEVSVGKNKEHFHATASFFQDLATIKPTSNMEAFEKASQKTQAYFQESGVRAQKWLDEMSKVHQEAGKRFQNLFQPVA